MAQTCCLVHGTCRGTGGDAGQAGALLFIAQWRVAAMTAGRQPGVGRRHAALPAGGSAVAQTCFLLPGTCREAGGDAGQAGALLFIAQRRVAATTAGRQAGVGRRHAALPAGGSSVATSCCLLPGTCREAGGDAGRAGADLFIAQRRVAATTGSGSLAGEGGMRRCQQEALLRPKAAVYCLAHAERLAASRGGQEPTCLLRSGEWRRRQMGSRLAVEGGRRCQLEALLLPKPAVYYMAHAEMVAVMRGGQEPCRLLRSGEWRRRRLGARLASEGGMLRLCQQEALLWPKPAVYCWAHAEMLAAMRGRQEPCCLLRSGEWRRRRLGASLASNGGMRRCQQEALLLPKAAVYCRAHAEMVAVMRGGQEPTCLLRSGEWRRRQLGARLASEGGMRRCQQEALLWPQAAVYYLAHAEMLAAMRGRQEPCCLLRSGEWRRRQLGASLASEDGMRRCQQEALL